MTSHRQNAQIIVLLVFSLILYLFNFHNFLLFHWGQNLQDSSPTFYKKGFLIFFIKLKYFKAGCVCVCVCACVYQPSFKN